MIWNRFFRIFLAASALALPFSAPLGRAQAAAPAPAVHPLRVFDASIIDPTVDACDNFYKFACNGWFQRNPLPADQTSYGRFTELYELNRQHLREILEASATPAPTRTANEQKIGDEYARDRKSVV